MAQFKSWDSFHRFQRELARQRRYVRTPESEGFLRTVFSTCKKRIRRIKKGAIFWRAQLGHDWRLEDSINEELPTPFSPARMLPLRDKAAEGRVNSKGIPCLYLATVRESALSEVRPWLGSLISVAQFEIKRDLRVVDCSVFHDKNIFPFMEELSPAKIERAVWASIDRAFAEPVTRSDDTAEYAATQAIAELFRSKGLDGVVYKSAFGEKGFNIAVFDLDCAVLLNCALHSAQRLSFEFREAATPYFINRKKKRIAKRPISQRRKRK